MKCPICNCDFQENTGSGQRSKYCSKKCAKTDYRRRTNGLNKPKNCPTCLMPFKKKSNRQIFCTKECAEIAEKRPTKQERSLYVPDDMMADKTAYDYWQA